MKTARSVVLATLSIILLTACGQRDRTQEYTLPTLMVLPSDAPTLVPNELFSAPTAVQPTMPARELSARAATFTPTRSCSNRSSEFLDQSMPIVQRFIDTAKVAAVTARASLAPLILELRSIQREYERLEYSDCTAEGFFFLQSGFDSAVEGFTAFLGDSSTLANVYFSLANQDFFNFSQRHPFIMDYLDLSLDLNSTHFIWGGDEGSEARATAEAATSQAYWLQLTATWTPTPTNSPTASRTPRPTRTALPTASPLPPPVPSQISSVLPGIFYSSSIEVHGVRGALVIRIVSVVTGEVPKDLARASAQASVVAIKNAIGELPSRVEFYLQFADGSRDDFAIVNSDISDI